MISDGVGDNLDWFWRGWFLTDAKLDLAVTGVRREGRADGGRSVVTLESHGGLRFPVPLELHSTAARRAG